ncbi:MAG: flagellin [Hyphomicrobiales bacterium]|nr:flagellin [Hyphomicrobiales bacterium]
MTSILTNNAAKVALQTLTSTMKSLDMTQSRISTGLRVGDASDNAAYWAIATGMRSDSSSLSTVTDALNLGASTIDVASNGLKSAIDVVTQIKTKLVAAAQPGIDRDKVQLEISQLQNQLKSISDSASFNGQNWLSVNSAETGYNATKSIVSSFSRDASGEISIGNINVNTNGTKLFDKGSFAIEEFGAAVNAAGVANTATGAVAAQVVTLTSVVREDVANADTRTLAIDFTDLSSTTVAFGTGTATANRDLSSGDKLGATAKYDADTKVVTITKIDLDVINSGPAAAKFTYSTFTISNVTLNNSTGGGLLDAADASTVGTYTDADGVTTSSASGGTGKSVFNLDIASLSDSVDDLATLNAFTKQAEAAISSLTTAASDLGAARSRVSIQQSFVVSLKNSIDKGIGALVDADMNEESTRLQALQVQQQLGVQALSIANQSSQSILSLFR